VQSETLMLSRVRVVLVSPSHPGNVGSCARAMKTMGLSELVLVAPRLENPHLLPEAVALASGATDVLAAARIVPDLTAALEGVVCAMATSSRERELAPPLCDAEQGAQALMARLHAGPPQTKAALVFGCERAGLSNEDLLRCDRHVMIPANPQYSSLNLSQAVQLLAYEVRKAALATVSPATLPQAPVPDGGEVSNPDVERLFEHFLKAMQAVDFLNPERPKRLIPRVRRLLQKAQLEREELDLLHGFLNDVQRVSQGRWYRAEWERLQQAIDTARQKFEAKE